MAFGNGSYARIWEIEDKGNYSVANISTSKKNKETNTYDTDFQHKFVRLVGAAHEFCKRIKLPAKGGIPVKIVNCNVTNKYDDTKKTTYWNCTVFELEDGNFNNNSNNSNNRSGANNNAKPKNAAPQYAPTDNDDVQLPF